MFFSGSLLLRTRNSSTNIAAQKSFTDRSIATALHRDDAGRKQHEEMGFHDGWGTVVTRMVEYIKSRL